jgi:oxygen-independent coproporphyrinogen-3 oxidase
MKPLNLYIHIPFCKSRCNYCSFFTTANKLAAMSDYFLALQKEFEMHIPKLRDYRIETIYIGGGTPSIVSSNDLKKFLLYIKKNIELVENAEISIETNPESIDAEKLQDYLDAGINRISIGLQAWQDELLKRMGRLYSLETFLQKLSLVKISGFKNIGLDLIFVLPGQSVKDWEETLDNVIKLNIQHISCYGLELDNDSSWGKLYKSGKLKASDEETDREMYELAKVKLLNAKFDQYEVSNFARSNFECKHNLNFWSYQPYIGLGAGAFSFFENHRFNNVFSIEGYISKMQKSESASENIIQVSNAEQIKEAIILGLRKKKGINFNEFENHFSVDIRKLYENEITELLREDLVVLTDSHICLSGKGLDFENEVDLLFY